MSKYTHEKEGANFKILREGIHIANYDPVDDQVAFTEEKFEKFRVPVGKVVAEINAAPSESVASPEPPAPKAPTDLSPATLKRQNQYLRVENARLRDQVAKARDEQVSKVPKPERFADEVDMRGAPVTDPSFGDLTPEFVKWARETWPKEIFEKRYKGRLPELPKK